MQTQLYDKFRSSEIVFSKNTAADLGLSQGSTVLKAGQISIKGAVLSSSMEKVKVIIKVNPFQQKYIFLNSEFILLELKFQDPFLDNEHSFSIPTSLIEMKKHGYKKDGIYKLNLEIKQNIPDGLFKIFMGYHEREMDLIQMNGLINSVLVLNEKKYNCILHKINENSVIVNYPGNPVELLGKCALIVLKHMESGFCFDIKGRIKNKYHPRKTTVDLTFEYSMNQQGSRFRESFNVLRDLINL